MSESKISYFTHRLQVEEEEKEVRESTGTRRNSTGWPHSWRTRNTRSPSNKSRFWRCNSPEEEEEEEERDGDSKVAATGQ